MKIIPSIKIFTTVVLYFGSLGSVVAQSGQISGIVRTGDEKLQGATITVNEKTLLSDHSGAFSLLVEPGNYLVKVSHIGYEEMEKNILVTTSTNKKIEFDLEPIETLGEVVLLGSRSAAPRTNLQTPAPVDMFSSKQLKQTGQVNLMQMLNYLAPSLSASRQTDYEPIALRGLDPEHVLIQLNGTRYHNSAWINQGNGRGSLGRGSVANDLTTIPISAIDRIEILRDGASAQYGSDGIAGVINLKLKESDHQTAIELMGGQYYKGDGENLYLGLHQGFSLLQKGFLNFSADLRKQWPTYRGGKYEGTVYLEPNSIPGRADLVMELDNQKVIERGFDRFLPSSHVGNTEKTSLAFLMNGAYSLKKQTRIFWTGSFNNRNLRSPGAYRFPKNPRQVNQDLFPDGFQPMSKSHSLDFTGIAGVEGQSKNNWLWNFKSSYGYNRISDRIEHTNNASQSSLGMEAPTSFYLGDRYYSQLINTLSFSKNFTNTPISLYSLNLAWGAEWRFEQYRTEEGEEASWKNYDTVNRRLNGGVQGGSAISPDDVVKQNRNVTAFYIDLESELNKRFLLDLAGRYEYYSDYGGNLAGKLALRYRLSDNINIRSSLSNGFRAPSLQQRYSSLITNAWGRVGNTYVPAVRGIFPETHPVVRSLEVPVLKPEHSINLSGGITATFFDHISLAVDFYEIWIKNRIILSGILYRSDLPTIDSILSENADLDQIDQVQFYCNAINTRTYGVDLVINGKWHFAESRFNFTVAANINRTKLFGEISTSEKLPVNEFENVLFNEMEKTRIEKGQPESKIILNLGYQRKKSGIILTNTRFGSSRSCIIYTDPDKILYEYNTPKIITDLNLYYSPLDCLTISGGVNNLFNIKPDPFIHEENKKEGILIYNQETVPFGYNGGFYYLRLNFYF